MTGSRCFFKGFADDSGVAFKKGGGGWHGREGMERNEMRKDERREREGRTGWGRRDEGLYICVLPIDNSSTFCK